MVNAWMLTFGKCTDRQNLECLIISLVTQGVKSFWICLQAHIPETCQRRDLLTSYICILKYRTFTEENYTENCWLKKIKNCTVKFCVKILCKVNLWTSKQIIRREAFSLLFFFYLFNDANEKILYSCASTGILNGTVWLNTKESEKLLHIGKKCEWDF